MIVTDDQENDKLENEEVYQNGKNVSIFTNLYKK